MYRQYRFTFVLAIILHFISDIIQFQKTIIGCISFPPVPLGLKFILVGGGNSGIFPSICINDQAFLPTAGRHILIHLLISLIFIFGWINQYYRLGIHSRFNCFNRLHLFY